jgi:hypothetical protein
MYGNRFVAIDNWTDEHNLALLEYGSFPIYRPAAMSRLRTFLKARHPRVFESNLDPLLTLTEVGDVPAEDNRILIQLQDLPFFWRALKRVTLERDAALDLRFSCKGLALGGRRWGVADQRSLMDVLSALNDDCYLIVQTVSFGDRRQGRWVAASPAKGPSTDLREAIRRVCLLQRPDEAELSTALQAIDEALTEGEASLLKGEADDKFAAVEHFTQVKENVLYALSLCQWGPLQPLRERHGGDFLARLAAQGSWACFRLATLNKHGERGDETREVAEDNPHAPLVNPRWALCDALLALRSPATVLDRDEWDHKLHLRVAGLMHALRFSNTLALSHLFHAADLPLPRRDPWCKCKCHEKRREEEEEEAEAEMTHCPCEVSEQSRRIFDARGKILGKLRPVNEDETEFIATGGYDDADDESPFEELLQTVREILVDRFGNLDAMTRNQTLVYPSDVAARHNGWPLDESHEDAVVRALGWADLLQ